MGSWFEPLGRLAAVAMVAVPVSWFVSPTAGIGLVALFLMVSWVTQWKAVLGLTEWLRREDDTPVPEGRGAWEELFSLLHRRTKQERQGRMALQAMIDRFQRAAGAMPDGIALLDADGRIELSNPSAQDLLGIDPVRDRGALVRHLIRHPDFAAYLDGADFDKPLLLHMPPPRARTLSVIIAPFADSGQLLVASDVTELEVSERMQRDFVANVSHELRTPLTVICGFLEHLEQLEADPDDPRRRIQELIREQAGRMVRLVDDLLVLSRLEAQGMPALEEAIDIAAMIEAVVAEARQLSSGRHDIGYECASHRLLGDPSELRSALTNLVTNAVRYTPSGGRIDIRWTMDNGTPSITVSDNGIGIAAEHLPRLTERFYRIDRSRSVETGGTGLGLAIVRQVLVRHQANLLIDSQPGRGSTFRMHFPASRLATADVPAKERFVQAG